MILSAYYFCEWLLYHIYKKKPINLKYNLIFNQLYCVLFIILNTEIYFDFLFPYVFCVYILYLLLYIFKVSKIHNTSIIPNLSISLFSTSCKKRISGFAFKITSDILFNFKLTCSLVHFVESSLNLSFLNLHYS